jgi:hypothetical protein
MLRKIALFIVAIIAPLASPAFAGPKVVEHERIESCKPFSVDGSQVFESAWVGGQCAGRPKVTLRITDFTLELMCSVQTLTCVEKAKMTSEQLAHYESLKSTKPIDSPKVCIQRDGTWQREMITSQAALCSIPHNAARSYDFVMRKGCVVLGNLILGCTTLSDEQIAHARGNEIANK